MITLVVAGLLAGIVTSVSPCVLPVLPVVLTSAGRRKPYLIVAGLVLSFGLTTLFGSIVLNSLSLPHDLLRGAGIVVLVVLGAGLISRRVGELLERPFARIRGREVDPSGNGFVVGLALGVLYVPCAGPVLATIAVLGASGQVGIDLLVLTAAFAIGVGIPLLVVALAGNAVTQRVRAIRERARAIRVTAGATMLVVALAIGLNLTDSLQRTVPDYTAALQRLVEVPGAPQQLRELTAAPELTGISKWLNTPDGRPLSIAELRGKVVLVNFWTYSCVNCQRALPHIQSWHQTYMDSGLVVIGVHTPEFAFEHDVGNVTDQARALGVRYPVAIDNHYATWKAYKNRYWPAEYLIDASGQIRHTQFGEGDYADTQQQIRQLLLEANPTAKLPAPVDVPDATPTGAQTPELYLGYQNGPLSFSGSQLIPDVPIGYRFPASTKSNSFALAGTWTAGAEALVTGTGAELKLNYQARKVHLVLGGSGAVTVLRGGVATKTVQVSGAPTLYTLVDSRTAEHAELDLKLTPGIQAYAFTFG